MEPTKIPGVFKDRNKIFTENPECCQGMKVYGEKLVTFQGKEFRSWDPFRSKLAAAILKGLTNIHLTRETRVLYLGAATGTTVSHLSDIGKNGVIYAVENSPVAAKKLVQLCKTRENVIPILADANHPESYKAIVPDVDLIYQDISQRNQTEIFIANTIQYLDKNGKGILMIKSRSLDIALNPKEVYKLVTDKLKKQGFKIEKTISLSPYVKDHAAFLISP